MKRKMIYGLVMALSMGAFGAMPLMANSQTIESRLTAPIIRFELHQIHLAIRYIRLKLLQEIKRGVLLK